MPLFDWQNPAVQLVIQRVSGINRKVTPQDCEVSKTLRDVAEYYAANYEGSFDFMVSMRRNFDRWSKLTPAQCSGTINCLMADWVYQQKQLRIAERNSSGFRGNSSNGGTSIKTANTFKMPEATLPDLSATTAIEQPISNEPIEQVALNGTFTIILNETGEYRTIRLVDADSKMGKPAGTQIAQYLSGSDNESNYTGFAFITGKRIGMWAKFKSDSKLVKALETLLSADRQRQIDLGEAYAMESGNCFICGRKLTVPASLHRGTGPICASKYGI